MITAPCRPTRRCMMSMPTSIDVVPGDWNSGVAGSILDPHAAPQLAHVVWEVPSIDATTKAPDPQARHRVMRPSPWKTWDLSSSGRGNGAQTPALDANVLDDPEWLWGFSWCSIRWNTRGAIWTNVEGRRGNRSGSSVVDALAWPAIEAHRGSRGSPRRRAGRHPGCSGSDRAAPPGRARPWAGPRPSSRRRAGRRREA